MTSLVIVLVGLTIIIAYQHWRLLKLEDAFLMVLLKLTGVDVDGAEPGATKP